MYCFKYCPIDQLDGEHFYVLNTLWKGVGGCPCNLVNKREDNFQQALKSLAAKIGRSSVEDWSSRIFIANHFFCRGVSILRSWTINMFNLLLNPPGGKKKLASLWQSCECDQGAGEQLPSEDPGWWWRGTLGGSCLIHIKRLLLEAHWCAVQGGWGRRGGIGNVPPGFMESAMGNPEQEELWAEKEERGEELTIWGG